MYTLAQICEGRVVLFDTSALINHFPKERGGTCASGQHQFIGHVCSAIRDGLPIYITDKVMKEYLDARWVKACENSPRVDDRSLLRKRRGLINTFVTARKIIHLTPLEQTIYDQLEGILMKLDPQPTSAEKRPTDRDLVLTAMILSRSQRKNVSIVTTDYGLFDETRRLFPLARLDPYANPVYQRIANHKFQQW